MLRLSPANKRGGDIIAQVAITCSKCGSKMNEVSRETNIAEVDMDDLTEGQMADYMASELSDDYGDWAVTETTYECTKCKAINCIMN